jgi:hypothetical protein
MSGIQQNFAYGRSFGFENGWPVANIGAAYGGGFFAGQINVLGVIYNLVIAPKASGEAAAGKTWGTYGAQTGVTSVINGPTNSATLAALGADYQAAIFCEDLTIGGYTDWYLPALNELEVLYYYLKPSTTANDTAVGSNANAVSPEPISTNYTSGSPAQTISGIGFRLGETNAIRQSQYWTSTQLNINFAWQQEFDSGGQNVSTKDNTSIWVRAVRRVLA